MKESNDITTTFRQDIDKYREFKDYAKEINISLNSLLKISSAIGLKVMKGEFKNLALLDNPE